MYTFTAKFHSLDTGSYFEISCIFDDFGDFIELAEYLNESYSFESLSLIRRPITF